MWRGYYLQVTGITNQGMKRARNEDGCFAKAEFGVALLAVADGMGGHQAGNIASSMAIAVVERFWDFIGSTAHSSGKDDRGLINRMIHEANERILIEAESDSVKRGMGTTFTVGLLRCNHLLIGHVGDSRAYLIAGDQIRRLTRDHSLVEQLVQSGQVTPEEAQNHSQRHILTRALGTSSDLQVDITELDIDEGSALLFCTDGLTNLVLEREILAAVKEQTDPEASAASLIEMANSRGGFDNITVVLATDIGGK